MDLQKCLLLKSEAMVLKCKKMNCSLQVSGQSQPQVKKLKYISVLFTDGYKMEQRKDIWIFGFIMP